MSQLIEWSFSSQELEDQLQEEEDKLSHQKKVTSKLEAKIDEVSYC